MTLLACIALSARGGGGGEWAPPSPVATSASAPLGAAAPTAPTGLTVPATDGPAPVEIPPGEPAPVPAPVPTPVPVPVSAAAIDPGSITISAWWNNATWTGQGHPCRITVNIVKPSSAPGSALNFSVMAQTADPSTLEWHAALWTEVNNAIQVPLGQWVTLEYAVLEGDASTGRFYLAITPEGGALPMFWDDMSLRLCRKRSGQNTSACAPNSFD